MCGFVGFTGLLETREDVLRRMADRIIHRGPDMEGYHIGGTTKEDSINGYQKLKEASLILKIPITAIGVPEKLASEFELKYDNTDIWIYKRMMPRAFW